MTAAQTLRGSGALAKLLQGAGTKGLQVGNRALESALGPKSSLRVLLDRVFPNLDRNASQMSLLDAVPGGGTSARNAALALGAMGLAGAKGTRTAARTAAQSSLASRAGLKPGGVVGGLSGGAAGYQGDEEGRLARTLLGTALGAGAGAGAGLYGTAGVRGLRSGGSHLLGRMQGWDDLMSMGIFPRFGDKTTRGLEAFKPRDLLEQGGAGKLRDLLRTAIGKGDEAKVIGLSSGGRRGGSVFTGPLPDALRKARIRELDAGPIMNPEVAYAATNPKMWGKLKADVPGLERFYGTTGGDKLLDFGNPAHSNNPIFNVGRKAQRLGKGINARFEPRVRTRSLWDDLKKRDQQSPRSLPARQASPARGKYIGGLSDPLKRRMGATDQELGSYFSRLADEGNVNLRSVWRRPGGKPNELSFDVDLTKNLKGQAAKNPRVTREKATMRPKPLKAVDTRSPFPDSPVKELLVDELKGSSASNRPVLPTFDRVESVLGFSKADLAQAGVRNESDWRQFLKLVNREANRQSASGRGQVPTEFRKAASIRSIRLRWAFRRLKAS